VNHSAAVFLKLQCLRSVCAFVYFSGKAWSWQMRAHQITASANDKYQAFQPVIFQLKTTACKNRKRSDHSPAWAAVQNRRPRRRSIHRDAPRFESIYFKIHGKYKCHQNVLTASSKSIDSFAPWTSKTYRLK